LAEALGFVWHASNPKCNERFGFCVGERILKPFNSYFFFSFFFLKFFLSSIY